MTVHKAHIQVINGVTYKYQKKRIRDEMPLTGLVSKKWFLWRASYYWEYLGYYDTKSEMLRDGAK